MATLMAGLEGEWESLFVSREGPVADHLAARGLRFEGVSSLRPKTLARVVDRFDPDLIHAHDYRASLVAATLRRPVVSHLHNNYPWAKRLGPVTVAYRLASPRFRRIVTVSESVVEEHRFGDALRPKSVVVGNGLDFAEIQRKALGKVSLRDLVFMGRLTEQKDPLAFVRIVKALQRPERPVTATLLGAGDLWEECREAVGQAGLEEVLEMPGYLSNPYPTLASSKICVVTSRWEGFGLVALEAMSLGAVVLARRGVGGVSAIMEAISPELLCDSEAEFVAKAQALLEDEPTRATLASHGKAYVEREFALSRFIGQIEQVYAEALERPLVPQTSRLRSP